MFIEQHRNTNSWKVNKCLQQSLIDCTNYLMFNRISASLTLNRIQFEFEHRKQRVGERKNEINK